MARSRDIEYRVGFTGDTSQLEAAVKKATDSLDKLGANPKNLQKGLEGAADAALNLSNHLKNAYNADTGKLDLTQFRLELEKGGMSIKDYAARLQRLGPEGEQAFMNVASAIGAAELPLRRTNQLFDKLWITLKNTARWRLTTGAINALVGGMQQAFGYAKSLDASLNNIRIVTGKSAEDMAKFAKEANRAAQALSTTTTTYTDASLIYYQQGLNDEEVKGRTDTTVKMANVTGQTAETISQQMTAIWNNFYDGTESLESYADSMVALGAATATSSKEIAEGLEKFAPVAQTVGLSFDYATAALATITATTRESASVAGTALKTLFSRLEGLKLGETLDDGTDLNKYSNALLAVGVNIKDANGQLKNMDTILDELGARWQTLAKDQQMALAETVGGVRQYAQLVALMDNWDFFQKNLATSRGAEGSLQEQANIYAESWEAARDRVKSATENIYDSLINPEQFIGIDKALTPLLNIVSSIVDAFGGLTGILPVVVVLLNKLYGDKIAQSMRDFVVNIGLMTGAEQERARSLQAEFAALVDKMGLDYDDNSTMSQKISMLKDEINLKAEINAREDQLSDVQKQHIQDGLRIVEIIKQQAQAQGEVVEKAQEAAEEIRGTISGQLSLPNRNATITRIDKGKAVEVQSRGIIKDNLRKIKSNTSAEIKEILGVFTDKSLDNVPSLFNKIDEALNKALDKSAKINVLKTALGDVDKESKNWKNHVKELAQELNILQEEGESDAAYFQRLRHEISDTGVTSQRTEQDISLLQNMLRELGADDRTISQYTARLRDLAKQAEQNKWTQEQWNQAIAKTKEEILNMPKTTDWANTLVSIGSAISQTALALRSLDNLGNIFNNEDLSTGEKLVQLLTTLSMLLPIVGGAVKTLGGVISGTALTVQSAVPLIAVASMAIYGIIKAIDHFVPTQKKAQEALKQSAETYKEAENNLISLQDELKATTKRLEELQEKANNNELTITEQEELNKLQQENIELERKIALEEKLNALALKTRGKEIEKEFDKSYNGIIPLSPSGVSSQKIGGYGDAWNLIGKAGELSSKYLNYSKEYGNVIALLDDGFERFVTGSEGALSKTEALALVAEKVTGDAKEEFEDYVNTVYSLWDQELLDYSAEQEETYNQWISDHKELYRQLEADYTDYIKYIQAEGKELDPEKQQVLQRWRKFLYPDNYNETFIDPVINKLKQGDLVKLMTGQIDDISQDIKNLIDQSGVSTSEITDRFSSIYNAAKAQLSKFGLDDWTDQMSYNELTLMAKLSTDPAYDDFKAFYTTLQAESGIIPVSIQIQTIKDTQTEALEHLATGEMLDEDFIAKIQEAYQGIYDLSDLADWSVQRQIQFLQNNNIDGIIAQQSNKIGELKRARDQLDSDISQTQEALKSLKQDNRGGGNLAGKQLSDQLKAQQNLKIAVQIDLDRAEKELNKLKEKVTKDPWRVEIDMGNSIAAELNNVKAAMKLINEDLSVDAKNLVELGKRYPEALVNAIYEESSNILHINEKKYNALNEMANDSLDKDRDRAVQRLLNEATVAEGIINVMSETEREKRDQAQITLDDYIGNEGSKKEAAVQAAVQGLIAVVKAEVQKRSVALSTGATTQAEIAAVTTTTAENAQIMAQNYGNAATAIIQSFNTAFRAIADGSAQVANGKGQFVQRFSSAYASASVREGALGPSANEIKAQYQETDEHKAEQHIIDQLNVLAKGLQQYLEGTTSWEGIQEYLQTSGLINNLGDGLKTALTGADPRTTEGFNELLGDISSDEDLRNAVTGYVKGLKNDINQTIANLLGSEEPVDKKGGGGGSKKDNKNLKKDLEDIEDRYHEINRQIERQDRLLSELEKQSERTYGPNRLKLFDQQLAETSKRISLLNEKSMEANEYLLEDKAVLEGMSEDPKLGIQLFKGFNIQFREGQEIQDYDAVLQQIVDAYNAFIDKYEAAVANNTVTEELEAQKEQEDKIYQARLDALKKYEDSLNNVNTLRHEIEDELRKQEDIKLDKVTYKIKLVFDARDARKQINDFSRAIQESLGDALTHSVSAMSFDEMNKNLEMQMYTHYLTEYNELKDLLDNATKYTDTDAIIEELKTLEGNIIETGESLLEWLDKVENMYVDALEDAATRFEEFTNQMQHNTEVLGLIRELYTLQGVTYKTEAGFIKLQAALEGQYKGYLEQAKLNKTWYEYTTQELEKAQSELDALIAQEGENAETHVNYDMLKKNRDALLAESNEAQQAMLESSKSAMETLREMYLEQVDKLSYDLEKRLSNGLGFELQQEKYDHLLEESDRYLDKVEEGLETALWYSKLQEIINNTTNKTYKEQLRRLQEEIDLRRQNNTLSEYDLELLEAKLRVAQAQADLEDAQNNKNQLRLVRDSNGNWNYEFTANQGDIEAKEQNLLSAKKSEYEITVQRERDLADARLQVLQDFKSKSEQIAKDYLEGLIPLEEANARLEELKRYTETTIGFLNEELGIAKRDMGEAALTSSVLSAGLVATVYQDTEDLIKNIVDVFKTEGGDKLIYIAANSLTDLQRGIAGNVTAFKDSSESIKAALMAILTTTPSDSKYPRGNLENLVEEVEITKDQLTEALSGWERGFNNTSSKAQDFINAIVLKMNGEDDDSLVSGIGSADEAIFNLLLGDNEESLGSIFSTLSGTFEQTVEDILGSLVDEGGLVEAISEHVPALQGIFDNFTNSIDATAAAIGIDPDSLTQEVGNLTNKLDILGETAKIAAEKIFNSLDVIRDTQREYSTAATAIWEMIAALQALAGTKVASTIESYTGKPLNGGDIVGKYMQPTGDASQRIYGAEWVLRNADLTEEERAAVLAYQQQENEARNEIVRMKQEEQPTAGYKELILDELHAEDSSTVALKASGDMVINELNTKENIIDHPLGMTASNIDLERQGAAIMVDANSITSAATGAYTGDFHGGKLAILHEKELVLNAEDTRNILSAVDMVRTFSSSVFKGIADQLDIAGAASMALLGSHLSGIEVPSTETELEQHVTIESVNFPGVTSSREIEEAFESLVNDAAQWARRRKS